MRKSLLRLLAVASAVLPASVATAALPQLGNPSAELASATDSDLPDAWQAEAWGNVVFDHAWTKADAFDGSRALRVSMSNTGTEGDARWISAPIDVSGLGGATVSVRHAFRSSTSAHVWAQAGNADGSKFVWLSVGPTKASLPWIEHHANLEIPAWVTTLRLAHVLSSVGWLETDAWVLADPVTTPVDPPIDPTATTPTDPSLPALSPKDGNILPNPSFESASAADANAPAYWTFVAWGAAAATTQGSWTTGGAAQGNRALHMVQTAVPGDGDGKWWSAPVPVKDFGIKLRLTCSYQGTAGVTLLVRASDPANAESQWYAVATGPSWDGWRLLSGTLTLPPWTAAVRVGARIEGLGDVDVDLCSLAAAAPPAPLVPKTLGATNILGNPSFEEADPWDIERPSAWTAEIWGDLAGSSVWQALGYQGDRSVRLDVSSKGAGEGEARWQSAKVKLVNPGWAEVRDRVRSTAPSFLRLLAQSADGSQSQWYSSEAIPASPTTWSEASFVVQLPDWTSTIQVSHGLVTAGTVELDSMALLQTQANPGDPADPVPSPGPADPVPDVVNVGANNCVPNATFAIASKVYEDLPWWWGGSSTGALGAAIERVVLPDGSYALAMTASGVGEGSASVGSRHFAIQPRATWAKLSAKLRGQGVADMYLVTRDAGETVSWRAMGRVALAPAQVLASGLVFVPESAVSLQVLVVLRAAGSVEVADVRLIEADAPAQPSAGDNTAVAGFNVGPVGPSKTDHGSQISGCSAGPAGSSGPGTRPWPMLALALAAAGLLSRRRRAGAARLRAVP